MTRLDEIQERHNRAGLYYSAHEWCWSDVQKDIRYLLSLLESHPDAAAEAIAKLVEEQPVDKARAMAALVRQDHPFGDYCDVPGDNGVFYQVDKKTLSQCWNRHTLVLCSRGDCIHIQAVKLHLAAQETTRS